MSELKQYIRDIPDFPKKGILFKDITTLIGDGGAFGKVVDGFVQRYKDKGISKVVAAEARGFIFGGAVAHGLGAAFVPVRKKGKLPYKTIEASYELEYGTDTVYMHEDAIVEGEKALILDDLLATGGTAKAICELVEKLKGDIYEVAFMIELSFLNGREKLKDYNIFSLITY
ncbi:MAG: adenine phosphoribosyltransferase [Candidatus Omnitrophica bacterium]|nr:adenine phosphoribosyltransferase [Candidatus Omnitrophota bacterium]